MRYHNQETPGNQEKPTQEGAPQEPPSRTRVPNNAKPRPQYFYVQKVGPSKPALIVILLLACVLQFALFGALNTLVPRVFDGGGNVTYRELKSVVQDSKKEYEHSGALQQFARDCSDIPVVVSPMERHLSCSVTGNVLAMTLNATPYKSSTSKDYSSRQKDALDKMRKKSITISGTMTANEAWLDIHQKYLINDFSVLMNMECEGKRFSTLLVTHDSARKYFLEQNGRDIDKFNY